MDAPYGPAYRSAYLDLLSKFGEFTLEGLALLLCLLEVAFQTLPIIFASRHNISTAAVAECCVKARQSGDLLVVLCPIAQTRAAQLRISETWPDDRGPRESEWRPHLTVDQPT